MKNNDIYIQFLQEYYQKNGTINNIPNGYVVMYNGQKLDIYNFLSRIRIDYNNYLNKINTRRGVDSPLALSRYQALSEMEFVWDLKETRNKNRFDTDIYIRFLLEYYQEHGTINDIIATAEVEYEGQIIKIGKYLNDMRTRYLKYGPVDIVSKIKSRKIIAQYKALAEMKIDWTLQTENKEEQISKPIDDKYIKFLQKYYQEHGTINDIPANYIVEFEGKRLDIYNFLRTTKANYKKHITGSNKKRGVSSELSLYRYEALKEMDFCFENATIKKKEAREQKILNYLKQHYKKHGTINDISNYKVVLYKGEALRIGDFLLEIRHLHRLHVIGDTSKKASTETLLKQYKFLERLEINWESKLEQKRKNVSEEIEIKFLRAYYEKNGTINNISSKTIVRFEGQIIKIGAYISKIRSNHTKYSLGDETLRYAGELALARYSELESMGIIWDNRYQKRSHQVSEEIAIRYLREHYKIFGTINNITKLDIVVFEGKQIKIGEYLITARQQHRMYLASPSDSKKFGTEIYLERYQILDEMDIAWQKDEIPTKKSNKQFMKEYYALTERLNGNPRKAAKIVALNTKTNQEKDYTIGEILREFILTPEEFISCLDKSTLKTKTKMQDLKFTEDMTLSEFCKQSGYKRDILQKAIKLKTKGLCDEELTSLINRALFSTRKYNQRIVPNWIYLKYGNDYQLSNLLSFIDFDKEKTLTTMKDNLLTLPEVIEDECFVQNSSTEDSYLIGVFKSLARYYEEVSTNKELIRENIELTLWNYEVDLCGEYDLTIDELTIIVQAFKQYREISHKQKLFDVAFESDETKKIQKIISYNLEPDDIEEAFFLPLQFAEKDLVGRNSETYKRRILLRNLTLSWDDLSEEEREEKITSHSLTPEEQHYVKETRQTINNIKEKVLKK